MYLQSIKSVKHNAAKSANKSILKKSRHIGFDVFIVHSSMGSRMPPCTPTGVVHANYAPKLFTEPYVANVSVSVSSKSNKPMSKSIII
jgi:hypothetical protein